MCRMLSINSPGDEMMTESLRTGYPSAARRGRARVVVRGRGTAGRLRGDDRSGGTWFLKIAPTPLSQTRSRSYHNAHVKVIGDPQFPLFVGCEDRSWAAHGT